MKITLAAILLTSLLAPFGGKAHRKTEEGNRSYLDARYEDALRAYTEAQVELPAAAELYYDIGNVLFRQEDYAGAAEAYTRALLTAPTELEGAAAYNLGNARYKLEEYEEAIRSYERALRSDAADADAKRNLELALRAQEMQQQQQQDEQQQDGEEPSEGDQQSEQQGEQEQGEQEQQEDGEQPQPQEEEGEQEQQENPSGGEGEEDRQNDPQGGEEAARPDEMTAEDAERMLDGLEEQELENLREDAQRVRSRQTKTAEKDW